MSDEPSHEEVMKVRRHECAINGHQWDVIQLAGHPTPHSIICSHCGESYRIAVGESDEGDQ